MNDQNGPPAWLNRVTASDGELVLELGGEIDLATIETVQKALDEQLTANPTTVIFELRELRFIDSSGIALLIATTQRAQRVELRHPSPTVRRVIELTGLNNTLPTTP